MLKFYKEIIVPAGLIAALIIGAGMFSLPYLFSLAGVWLGFLYLFLFAVVFSAVHVMYLDIIKHTPGEHRFVGYAKIHLGQWGFWTSITTTMVGLILVLLIYLVLGTLFAQAIFPGLDENLAFLIFWVLSAGAVILGINKIAGAGLAVAGFMVLIMIGVFFAGVGSFESQNFSFSSAYIFAPFAAVLFSLAGRSAISTIHEYMKSNRISEKRIGFAITLGTIAPALLYALFVVGILGITGGAVSVDSVTSVREFSPRLGILMAVLGLFSLWTSYVFLGIEAKKIISSDLKVIPFWAAVIVSFLPVAMYFGGFNSFLPLIKVSGGILLALESILLILIWRKVMRPHALLSWGSMGLVIVFWLGIFSEIYF